jgi:hypothetical protein
VPACADEAVLQALGRRLLDLCHACRDTSPRGFQLSCRDVTHQLEEERRRAEGAQRCRASRRMRAGARHRTARMQC